MAFILASVVALLVGTALCLLVPGNSRRAWVSISSQAIACIFVLIPTVPILVHGSELQGELHWSFPVDRIGLRIDALSAFFLAFSLPMTLAGTLYALGYLAPYFDKKRHAGLHF